LASALPKKIALMPPAELPERITARVRYAQPFEWHATRRRLRCFDSGTDEGRREATFGESLVTAAKRYSLGMIHGRFQSFHNGHLAYLLGAARLSARLLVGITNPDRARTLAEEDDPRRHLPENNPFTYTERLLMVEAAAREARLGPPVHVIPFPVNEPELWPDYVPPGTVHFLRVFSPWGATKLERLRAAGFEVVVLDGGAAKDVSGEQVRTALRRGEGLDALVPPAVARVIRSLPAERVRNLRLTA
jgi:nicotinamide-nucleotide adenylyltransferase